MATMGLRRRVQVSTGSSGQSSSAAGKRTRSENNNSPSQGNLNSPGSEPASKKPRGSAASSTRAAAKAKELDLKKMASAGPPLWSDPRPYASIAGLSIEAQRALCSEGLPSPMYMSQAMATFVGNATNLGKSPAVSYLDISNMTARPPAGWPGSGDEAAKNPIGLAFGAAGAAAAAALAASAPFTATSATTLPAARASPLPLTESAAASSAAQLPPLPKNFPNDSMFNAYQPWVIKTYGDLAKTKTITIKKYARILRTLRGEEVNSAENSKFRFWVKSKGFHIGQPEGYEPKPADRIIGRHAVTNPGLDPPLYVPTQPPHNKTLNGAESTVAPGRVYKKVAIVENFFDIIHAVHVDLEGRPGKHAGQKRTYRTITETYAFLPREAVTRFLLGCTECQRRPRTPSPTSLTATPKPDTPTTSRTPTPTATTPLGSPPSPKAATTLSSCASPTPEDSERPREASNPPESKNPQEESPEQPIGGEATAAVSTSATTTAATAAAATSTASIESNAPNDTSSSCKSKIKDERYNPLSITNLLRKDPVTRRPPPPTITTTLPLISAPETLTTTSICCASTVETCSSPSIVQAQNSRLLPETCVRRSTPSPSRPASQPRSWSPATEPIKSAPIDYSVTTVVPAQLAKAEPSHRQPRLPEESAEEPKSKKVNVEPVAQKEAELPKTEPRSNSSSESENETEAAAAAAAEERDFSPAAGLIGQNLNLLATIQQLHCQVMLALTERLRPAASASSVVAAATAAAAAAAAASAVSPASASRGAEAGDS